jgi:hypothetical protein
METNARRHTVAGVFPDEASANAALTKLVEAHFDVEADASVIVSSHHDRQMIPIWSDVPVTRTALIGAGGCGVVAAAAMVILGIDFGPFSLVEWGTAFAAFEAAFAAGSVGMVIGIMMSFEFTKPAAAFHLSRIHDGVIWVGVQAAGARVQRARQVLTDAGARHFMDGRPEVAAA